MSPAPLLLCPLAPTNAGSALLANTVEVQGARRHDGEDGSGESILFVHGASSNLRARDLIREDIARKHGFIAYTQRYFGTDPRRGDGNNIRITTYAEDLAKLVGPPNVATVNVVGSSGGAVAATGVMAAR